MNADAVDIYDIESCLVQYSLLQEGERRRKGAKATFSRKWNETKSHDRGTKCSQNILSLPAVRMETVNEKMLLWCQGGVIDIYNFIIYILLINYVLRWLEKVEGRFKMIIHQ